MRQAFVVTVAGAVAGCFGTVTTNPPDPTAGCAEDDSCPCPEVAPSAGSACPDVGLLCAFGGGSCPTEFSCTEDGWQDWSSTCNPPPPDCPEALPESGAACEEQPGTWGYPSFCQYEVSTPCGLQQVEANCVAGDVGIIWEVTVPEGCQTSPEACGGYAHPDLCDADAGCRWLAPGCAEEGGAPPAPEGCHPAGDCLQTDCAWGTCETVIHDPCFNDFCTACGTVVNVCVPSGASGG